MTFSLIFLATLAVLIVTILWPFTVLVHRHLFGHWHPLGALHWYFGCPERPR